MKVSVYLVNNGNLKKLKMHLSSIGQNVIVRTLPNEFINTDADEYWTDSAGVFARFTHLDKGKFVFFGDLAKVKEKELAGLEGIRNYPELSDELIQTIADSSAPFFANADPSVQGVDPICDQEMLYNVIRTSMQAVEAADTKNNSGEGESEEDARERQAASVARQADAEQLRKALNIPKEYSNPISELNHMVSKGIAAAATKLADLSELINDPELVQGNSTLISQVGPDNKSIPVVEGDALTELPDTIAEPEEIVYLQQQEALREEMFLEGKLPEIEFETVSDELYTSPAYGTGWSPAKVHDIFIPADTCSIQSGVINAPARSNVAEVMQVPEQVDLTGRLVDVDTMLSNIESDQQSMRTTGSPRRTYETPGLVEFGIVPDATEEKPEVAEVTAEVSVAEVVPTETAVEVGPTRVEMEAEVKVESEEVEVELELDLLYPEETNLAEGPDTEYTPANIAQDAIALITLPQQKNLVTEYGSLNLNEVADVVSVESVANSEFDKADADNYQLAPEIKELEKVSDMLANTPPIPESNDEFEAEDVTVLDPSQFIPIFDPNPRVHINAIEDLMISSDDDEDEDEDAVEFGRATTSLAPLSSSNKRMPSLSTTTGKRPLPAKPKQPNRLGRTPSVSIATPGSKLISQVQEHNSMAAPGFAPQLQDCSQIATVQKTYTKGKINTKRQLGGNVYIFGSTARKSGASLLAYNFACERSRELQKKVILIDLDFTSAMLSRKIYDSNKLSMNDSCGIENVLQVSAQDYLTRLDIFTARVCNEQGDEFSFIRSSQEYPYQIREFLTHANFTELLNALRTVYDVIIVDLGTFKDLSKYKLDLLKSSYTITAVFNCLSQKTVLDSYMVLETIPRACYLVLNNYTTSVNPIEISKATQRRVIGTINTSHAISVVSQLALLREVNQSNVAADWLEIVTELTTR